jgi:hypothetical protein
MICGGLTPQGTSLAFCKHPLGMWREPCRTRVPPKVQHEGTFVVQMVTGTRRNLVSPIVSLSKAAAPLFLIQQNGWQLAKSGTRSWEICSKAVTNHLLANGGPFAESNGDPTADRLVETLSKRVLSHSFGRLPGGSPREILCISSNLQCRM